MAKKITGYIKLQVPAGAANPSPPIGPALGQRGVNIMEFCKAFNAATQELEKGMPIPTVITVYADRSFSFATKTPPASFLLKKAARSEVGLEGAGQGHGGRRSRRSQLARDRRAEDEGSQRQRSRGGDQDHRRLRPRDGPPGGGGLSDDQADQEAEEAQAETVDREKLYAVDEAIGLVKSHRHRQVRRDRRAGDEPGRRPAPRRPDGPRRGQPAQGHRQGRPRRGVRAAATRPRKPRRPAPKSSAPRI